MEACEVASHVSRRFPTIHLKNHYSRTSKPSDKNVEEEAKKLHVLPFHDVTLWKSNFTIRVVHVKGEELEVSLPHHLTGNQDDHH